MNITILRLDCSDTQAGLGILVLRYMGTIPWYSAIFTKGNLDQHILFSFLDDGALPNWVNSYRKKIVLWEQILLS